MAQGTQLEGSVPSAEGKGATLVRGRYVVVRAALDGRSQVLTNAAVAHEDGLILDVGPFERLRREPDMVAQVFTGRFSHPRHFRP